MAIISELETVINSAYLVPDTTCVREENIDGRGERFIMERQIISKPGVPFVLYRFDGDPEKLFPYFQGGHNLRRMCDYVLIAEWQNKYWCLLIELKKGREDARPQLEAGEALMRFILSTAERVGKQIQTNEVMFRKIRVAENTKCKRSLKATIPKYDETHFLNLLHDYLPLKQLLH